MNAKRLEGRVQQFTEGCVCIAVRQATMTENVVSEVHARIPLAAIQGYDLRGTLMVDETWIRENLGAGILGPQAALDPPKSAAVALDKSPAFRRLMMKYHPDTARGGLFTASEIAADLNALADSLKYDRKGE